MESWSLLKTSGDIFLTQNGNKSQVKAFTTAGLYYGIDFQLTTGEWKEVNLREFKFESPFSKTLIKAVKSRSWFLNKLIKSGLQLIRKKPSDTSSSDSGQDMSDSSSEGNENSSMTAVTTDYLKKKMLGVFEVHVENLVSPPVERAVRPINAVHLGELEKSLLNNQIGQVTTLVGMLKEAVTNIGSLIVPGTATVEVLGGNHSHLAIKSLYRKGVLSGLIKVRLYNPLIDSAALKLGLEHNYATEVQRPMTFLEIVGLIRGKKPADMTCQGIRQWKEELLQIFGDKSLDLLEGRLQNHIALARVSDDVWKGILSLDDEISQEIKQTFFRRMVSFPEDAQLDCLEALNRNITAYKAKVIEFSSKFPKRKRKKSNDTERVHELVACQNFADVEEETLQEETPSEESLQEESLLIQEESEVVHEEEGAPQEVSAFVASEPEQIKYSSGETIWGEWKDGCWYEAEIKKVEVVYHVVYKEDGKRRKLNDSQIKRAQELNITSS